MKKVLVFFALISLLLLLSCTKKETYPELIADTSTTDINTDAPQVRTKYSEIKISDVNELKVFNKELYILKGGRAIGTSDYVTIHKYIDEKTPPEILFEVKWPAYSNRRKVLNSFEEYNGELYAGGPLGVFKLDKQSNKFKEVEFSYGFDYVKDREVEVMLIRTIKEKLYAILNYATTDPYSDIGISLVVLEGNTWRIIAKNIMGPVGTLKEHSGEFYIDIGGIAKLHKDKNGKQYWVRIPDKIEGYGENIFLEKYNELLYVCGEDKKIYSINPASIDTYFSTTDADLTGILSDSVREKLREMWIQEHDYKNSCTFIKNADGKIHIGFQKEEESDELLYVFDGKNWKTISFTNAPGLSEGQSVIRTNTAEYFNGKLFIAVNTNPGSSFEMQPSFYTLDNDGVLAPITWWKE